MPDIHHRVVLNASPERVYRAISTQDGIRRWWTKDAALDPGVVITTNLSFSEWGRVSGDTKITTALLDRLTDHCHILETCNDSFRFRTSSADGKGRKTKTTA